MDTMRAKRSSAPSIAVFTSARETVPAGATRAIEPVFEQMAREAHARALVRGSEDDGPANGVEHWLTS